MSWAIILFWAAVLVALAIFILTGKDLRHKNSDRRRGSRRHDTGYAANVAVERRHSGGRRQQPRRHTDNIQPSGG